jgi:hypothetical protein
MLVIKYNFHLYNNDNMNESRGMERQIMHCSKNELYIYIYIENVEMIVGLQYG